MSDIRDSVRAAGEHPVLERLARAGYVASGVVHGLIGWIAIRVARGGDGEADQGGAMAELQGSALGETLLWGCVIAVAGLACWQAIEAVVGLGGWAARLKASSKALLYAALGLTAVYVATGGESDGDQASADLTDRLLDIPFGQGLVALIGVVIVVVGAYHVYKGAAQRFVRDLRTTGGGHVGRGVRVAGVVGYVAKGISFLVLGALFVVAAWRADADEAGGLNQALTSLADRPFGTVLLFAVAFGLILFGIYSLARAGYARM